MSGSNSNPPDTFACKQELAFALGNGDLEIRDETSVQYQNSLFWVAIALGNCRLHGVDPEEYDGLLTISMATAALHAANRLMDDYERKLISYATSFDELDEDATICACQVLTDRMDLWAADIAITEVWELAVNEEEPGYLQLDDLFVLFSEKVLRIDEALDNCKALLYMAASTNLLSNWRQLVAPKFQDVFPWWLDGSIESDMERMRSYAERFVPLYGYDANIIEDMVDAIVQSAASSIESEDKFSANNTIPWSLIEERQKELEGTPGELAADWISDPSPVALKLFDYRATIEGDANVKIRFDAELSKQGNALVVINLVGRRALTQNYRSAILRLANGSKTTEPIVEDTAKFHVSADALNSSTKMSVVDVNGRERLVAS